MDLVDPGDRGNAHSGCESSWCDVSRHPLLQVGDDDLQWSLSPSGGRYGALIQT